MVQEGKAYWRPRASLDVLSARAHMNGQIRDFFAQRSVLEVETPLLASATVTDVNLKSFRVSCETTDHQEIRYLQTSPEFGMKRLLAAGSGPIYQICKAFRDGEVGRSHNPEFTLLEWYRPGFDHHQLMDELDDLIQLLLGLDGARKISYRNAFRTSASVDPVTADINCLRSEVRALGVRDQGLSLTKDDYLDLLLTHVVQPALPPGSVFIYDFPASQAALANVRDERHPVAERFELFIDGVEVANGYHELTDPLEQRRRFERDLAARQDRGLPLPGIDKRFLAALHDGLPPCSGVAVGLDRLLVVSRNLDTVAKALAFPWACA